MRRTRRGRALLVDAAAVTAAWAAMLVVEVVVLGFAHAGQFSGVWEIGLARRSAVPLAALGLAPASLLFAWVWRLANRRSRRSRVVLAALGVAAAGAAAWGVTTGRHFVRAFVRVPFVVVFALAGAALLGWGLPVLASPRRRPADLAAVGVAVVGASWIADAYVLPRLYPAFHAALFAAMLMGGALVAFAGRPHRLSPGWIASLFATVVAIRLGGCAAQAPRAVAELDGASNLRLVLVEHAPLLGPAVEVLTRLRASEPAPVTSVEALNAPGEVARSLDWSGRDVLLLTVDALRADHVSDYGYGRPTTPNIDALAHEGTAFDHAYCPTPHTSYSITSMMTGKYLRPLLALGLGQDSDTWAHDVRRYDWRTAAFYPPAVFYIDEDRFAHFEQDHLGFEYAKVEFADPALRERQVAEYLATAPADKPLFLWVHFFEPHEPYVMHPEHPFDGGPSADVDAYDSEVATADDGIGRLVRLVRARRRDAVVILTADHGEEFGEHGGRYHGTTVYEEQVRVPMVVVGPGVRKQARVAAVVQTIDLLPTTLSAMGIPRPARLRGRDLGPWLADRAAAAGADAGPPAQDDEGFAFAETDDYALIAAGADRLVCERRAAACALYRPAEDPLERHDRGDEAGRLSALRARLRALERDHGRFEAGAAPEWPEALRRGLQGEVDAAPDVAALLDDADVIVRRKAAEVCFGLHAPATVPQLRRALARDEDDDVRRWSALAVARTDTTAEAPPLAVSLLHDGRVAWRRAAALAVGARGDVRACDEITAWWNEVAPGTASSDADGPPRLGIDLARAREWLGATGRARCRAAVPALLRALEDVRARPAIADTLGALADDRAREPLLEWLADEPYVTSRPHEARALLALGASTWSSSEPKEEVELDLRVLPRGGHLVMLLSDASASASLEVEGVLVDVLPSDGEVRAAEVAPRAERGGAALSPAGVGRRFHVALRVSRGGALGLWWIPGVRLN